MTETESILDTLLAALLLSEEGLDRQALVEMVTSLHPQSDCTEALDELLHAGWGPLECREQGGKVQLRLRQRYLALLPLLGRDVVRPLRKALLETLAIIAYEQPITRPEIEHWRGVSVATGLLQQLQELGWIEIKGYREGPGRPALWGTTREFLRHFDLPSLEALPLPDERNSS